MAERSVEIRGLKDFRRELRKVSDELPKEMRDENKQIADDGARLAQVYALGMGGVQAKAAGAIKGYATAVQASIGFPGKTARYPMAPVAFWGARKHTGWYAHINSNAQQHPDWVGNSWMPGSRGQGPYAINDAVADLADELPDRYGEMVERLAAKAFPD